jgi:hypothetical protein
MYPFLIHFIHYVREMTVIMYLWFLPKGTNHFGDLDVDRRMILKWFLKVKFVQMCNEFCWLKIGFSGWLRS